MDFQRSAAVGPGSTLSLAFNISAMQLSIVDLASGDRVLAPGSYELVFSAGSAAAQCTLPLRISGAQLVLEAFPVLEPAQGAKEAGRASSGGNTGSRRLGPSKPKPFRVSLCDSFRS